MTQDRREEMSWYDDRFKGLLLLLFLGFLGWYYTWQPASSQSGYLLRQPAGLYHSLTDSFLSGRISLLEGPSSDLVRLENPYDPAKNAPWRRNDLSYFKGKYYLYHTAVPVIVLFIPVKMITGRYLAEDTAVGIFLLIGAASGFACLGILRREYFPGASPILVIFCAGALALGGAQFAVLRDANMNHVAIACASSFLMLAFYAALKSLREGPGTVAWLALAGAFEALAAVSRPNFIYGSFGVFAILLPHFRGIAGGTIQLKRAALLASALLGPMVVIGGIAACYNYERFENPFDFGGRYMLGAWDQTHLAAASLNGVHDNAWYYFLCPGIYSRYFPFAAAASWQSVGVIPHLPFLLFASLLLLPLVRRPAAYTGFVAFVFLANTISLLILPSGNEAAVLTSANSRYLPDFVTAFSYLACIGVLATANAIGHRRGPRRLFAFAVGFLALWSILANLSFDFQRVPAVSYRGLAQILDEPAALYERLAGEHYGPIALTAQFPGGLTGQRDPLVQAGPSGAADLIYVSYATATSASFGLASDGIEGPEGSPIALDYKKPHRIQIWMGSLYPPPGHPALRHLSNDAVTVAKRHLRVLVDGEVAIDDVATGHSALPNQVKIGSNPFGMANCSGPFRGVIQNVERPGITLEENEILPPVFGDVHLRVRFPRNRTGVGEPLVVTGSPNAGDFVYVEYLAGNRIRIGYDHWGRHGIFSDPFTVNFDDAHLIDISMSSLYPKTLRGRGVRVVVDGGMVLGSDAEAFDASPYEVAVLRNPIGGSTCSYAFTGEVLGSSRRRRN